MTTVYSYLLDGEFKYWSDRQTAISQAQKVADDAQRRIEVRSHKIRTGTPREIACALLMNWQWCIETKVVKTVRPDMRITLARSQPPE